MKKQYLLYLAIGLLYTATLPVVSRTHIGETGYLKNRSLTVKDDISIYKAAYTAAKDRREGKRGTLYIMVEDHHKASTVAEVYTAIGKSNQNHAGVKVLTNMGTKHIPTQTEKTSPLSSPGKG